MTSPIGAPPRRESQFPDLFTRAPSDWSLGRKEIYQYLKITFASSAALLVLAALFNLVVDAKGLYGLVRLGGFNSYKAYQNNYGKEVKAFGVRAYRPDTVLFGASTVDRGIVPECRKSTQSDHPLRIYNEASSGDSPGSFVTEYTNVRSIGTVRRIAIEARFPSHPTLVNGAVKHPPLSIPRDHGVFSQLVERWLPPQYATNYFFDFFSWKATVLNVKTVEANRGVARSVFYGYGPDGRFDQEWLKAASARVIDEPRAIALASTYYDLFISHLTNGITSDFSYVEAFAEVAARDGISLDFFIPPEHALLLLLYSAGGAWLLYEKFKMDLLQAVETAATRYGVKIRAFDFGTLNQATEQPIRTMLQPQAFDPYFEDPVHFRKIVGDFILASIFGCQITEPVPEGFGVQLSRQNIKQHLLEQRARLDVYRRSNAKLELDLTRRLRADPGGS